jgi:hypothetical protein
MCTQISKQAILSHVSASNKWGEKVHQLLEKPALEGDSALDCKKGNALCSFNLPIAFIILHILFRKPRIP